MDWFTWLSKTGLEATLVYEYGLAFAQNELEEEDISYFNHEFLQSMGISIAKHRLEILKLARKERRGPHPMSRVMVAIRRTKSSVSRYIRTWIHQEPSSSSALVVVPRTAGYRNSSSSRWRGARLKRSNKKVMDHQSSSRLLLTDGRTPTTPMWVSGPRLDSFSSPSPMIYNVYKEEEKVVDGHHDDGYWTSAVEEIRWDTMFQNLKPT